MMRRVIAILLLLITGTVATAQVPFPQTLPANTVYGRLGISAGPGQAIPFATLSNQLFGQGSGIFGLKLSGDTNYTMVATDRTVLINANLTAARTITLPAAGVITTGQQICIGDSFGGVTTTNTLTIARAGSDTIDGGTSYVLRSGFAGACLISDGSSKYTLANAAAIGNCTSGYFLGGNGGVATPTCQGFTNTGTGGATRTWQSKVQELVFSVKDYGSPPAVCDNSTNDAAAIQATIDAATAAGGGTVYIPGICRVGSTITINTANGITLRGSHLFASGLSTNSDIKLLSVAGGRHSIEDLQLLGVGTQGGNGTTASGNSHTLHFTSTCVDCYAHRLYIAGGFYGILDDGVDTIIEHVIAAANYNTSVRKTANALWMIRSKIDNPWPVSVPALGSSVAAWAGATAYAVGDVRLHPSGFYMQVRVAGTSGGAAPTLQNYGTDIVDGAGALRWRLVANQNSAALQITTGASEIHVVQSDFSGAQGRAAILIDNDGAGVAPFAISIVGGVVSQSIQSGIRAIAGNGLQVGGGLEVGQCVAAACSSIEIGSGWSGDTSITNTYGLGGATNGIILNGGVNATLAANSLFGYTNGIDVGANVNKFTIAGNNVGSSTKWGLNTVGIKVEAGTSNNYVILGNVTSGATTGVTDGGTGLTKTVQTTEGAVLFSTSIQTSPVAVASLPTCNAALEGGRAAVNNSNAASFTAGIGAIVAGGGAVHVPVYCDGTNWRIG